MGETLKDRTLGNTRSAEDNIVEVCRRLGVKADKRQIKQTVALNYEYTRDSIIRKYRTGKASLLMKL